MILQKPIGAGLRHQKAIPRVREVDGQLGDRSGSSRAMTIAVMISSGILFQTPLRSELASFSELRFQRRYQS